MPTGAAKVPNDEEAVGVILVDLQHWLGTKKPDLVQAFRLAEGVQDLIIAHMSIYGNNH